VLDKKGVQDNPPSVIGILLILKSLHKKSDFECFDTVQDSKIKLLIKIIVKYVIYKAFFNDEVPIHINDFLYRLCIARFRHHQKVFKL